MKKSDEERIEKTWGLALSLAYRAWKAGLLSITESESSYSERYLIEPTAEALAILAKSIVTDECTSKGLCGRNGTKCLRWDNDNR